MQRIMIIGGPGSGKSTLAKTLGRRMGLPVIHGDRFYFRPGWVERPRGEILSLFRDAAAGESWIIDGNSSATWHRRAERADLIVFLDMPRGLMMRRVLLRSLRYFGRTRPDMQEGCPERFDRGFLDWTWNWTRDKRPGALELIEVWQDSRQVAHLTSPTEVRAFLAGLPERA